MFRRFVIGVGGLTAIAITLLGASNRALIIRWLFTFWRLGKVKSWDAFFYIMAQFFED